MGIVMLATLIVVIAAALMAIRLVTRELPSASPDQERRLARQAEEIELLQAEVQRLREQADFTERLLSERSEAEPEDGSGADTRE